MAHPDDRSGFISSQQVSEKDTAVFRDSEIARLQRELADLRGHYDTARARAERLEETNDRLYREAAQNNAAMGIMARERDQAVSRLANAEHEAQKITERYAAYIAPDVHAAVVAERDDLERLLRIAEGTITKVNAASMEARQ